MTAANVRARVREQLTSEIVDVARRMLTTEGAAALSVRAVARELGMASSAVYRYFPSRDDLLTALIIEAYNALGETAERAETAEPRDDLIGRWRAACRAVREWALAHPHEYALVYGSPVPGYAAPQATIGPATRIAELFAKLLVDAHAAGRLAVSETPDAQSAVEPSVLSLMGPGVHVDPSLGDRAVLAWIAVYGTVSFELFGHLSNVVTDYVAFFDHAIDRLADVIGLR